MLSKKLVVAAMTGALVMTGTSAFAFGTKSTSLQNGTLSIFAQDGCDVSANCSLYYSSTTYKKTGGSSVSIQLGMTTGDSLYLDTAKTIKSGQTASHSWGGKSKAAVPDCTIVGYMKASTGDYYTPPVDVC
ncbi:hypothetical protein EDD90_6424 [Streptomyces sp. Ag109_O5-1]|uniref:hypothetical protein n=1 Tax=Streptomyces sp. Ag109_O5-1 TaxID=1938851 RepID=UPI000F4FFA45|nr:hypothetical protein [Streptomyces sp. Ag109_O5-1]RPE43232.1 hypothetical protein EDD90_6424 [Streptomyces sp. Ag109_O5-1]